MNATHRSDDESTPKNQPKSTRQRNVGMLNGTTLLLTTLLVAVFGATDRVLAVDRPDILLIMPDQMRGDCLSILGHPVVRTPQLDELARQGTLFRRGYSTVPSCIPARYALLTRLAPQTSGVVGFAGKAINTLTLPGALSELGYATVLVGRNMHQIPSCGTCGYQQQLLGSTYVSGDEYDSFLKRVAPETGGIRSLIANSGLDCSRWPAKPWPLEDTLHPTAWIVSQARRIVAETPLAKPLFLTVSFYAPHPPLFPPQQHFDACRKADLPTPAHGDWVDWTALSPKGDKSGHRVLLEGEILRAAQAGYFGLIEQLDNETAALIADFKARGEQAGRPWLIVVTSDHGEMLGDHGYFRKCEPYEGSANIPFIITGAPGLNFKSGQRSTQPVCLEDILPTLLELADGKRPDLLDGVSLVPVLGGEDRVVREWLHFEHSPCYSKEQAFQSLTDGHYKYIWRPQDGSEQLFNLDQDGREELDLSRVDAERPTLEKWRQRLIQRLAGRLEGVSDGQRLVPANASKGRR
jgi:arylsulfatase